MTDKKYMEVKKEERLIHKLLDETYSFIPETDSAKGPGDLYRYFCDQSHKAQAPGTPFAQFLEELSLVFKPVSWRSQTGCYRFHAFGHCFDLPSNWGPFAKINLDEMGHLHIHQQEDECSLLDVFSGLAGKDVEVVFLTTEGHELYVSFIEAGKEQNLSEILTFAQKSFSRAQNKRSA